MNLSVEMKSIDAAPTGMVDQIIHEQELLDSYGFEVVSGNCLLNQASIVLVTDTNHAATDHSNFGGLIQQITKPQDKIFVEAVDPEISTQTYELPRDRQIISWEVEEDYYMTLLLLDTRKRIMRRLNKVVLQNALSALAKSQRVLAWNHKMLAHPELLDQAAQPPEVEELLHTSEDTTQQRLQSAYEIIRNKVHELIIHPRNKGIVQAIEETQQAEKRSVIVAGFGHFTPEIEEAMKQTGYIVLRPTNLPEVTAEEIDDLKQPMSQEDRTYVKQHWLRARNIHVRS